MKNLYDKLTVSEAQLALSRSINNQPKLSIEPTSTQVQTPPPFQLPFQLPVHNNDIQGKENVENPQIERRKQRNLEESSRELCLLELIEEAPFRWS